MASITEVAKLAGVSTATASRVVGEVDYPVSETTRERVLAAARQLDYVPNALARGLLKSTVPMMIGTSSARTASKASRPSPGQ